MIVIACPDCGKHLLWHLAHEHRCDKQPQKSSPKRKPTVKPVAKTEPSKSSSPSSRRIDGPPVTTPARNYAGNYEQAEGAQRKAEVQRVTEWRKKPENRAKYNAYQRKRRAAKKSLE